MGICYASGCRRLNVIVNRNHFITPRAREALISLTAIGFIEEHALLGAAQLQDARKSLQALFLRTSGEESTLRHLIELLKTTRRIQNSFASISGTLAGVSKGVAAIEGKLAALRAQLDCHPMTAEANAAFMGPFLSFSQEFLVGTAAFAAALGTYLAARENEARAQSVYRITVEARERLRQRLSGRLAEAHDEAASRIKDEIVSSFDFADAQTELEEARHACRRAAEAVNDRLGHIQSMCQLAMNPALRDSFATVDPERDIFTGLATALPRHACLVPLKDPVLGLFRLYQHSHGMFQLDYQKLNRALDTMTENVEAYFEAKEEDRDLTAKREKLRKIEGLIPFLEQAAHLAADEAMAAYPTFSRELSAAISERRAPWHHVAEDLLRAKIQAEAEISTRL